jgi:hypothetical protein
MLRHYAPGWTALCSSVAPTALLLRSFHRPALRLVAPEAEGIIDKFIAAKWCTPSR